MSTKKPSNKVSRRSFIAADTMIVPTAASALSATIAAGPAALAAPAILKVSASAMSSLSAPTAKSRLKTPDLNKSLGTEEEVFNTFNIVSYGNPDQTITDADFGRITSTRSGPREMQLSVKYIF